MLDLIDALTRKVSRSASTASSSPAVRNIILRGVPGHVRSDSGSEFVAREVRKHIAASGAKSAFVEPGSPWDNGNCENFNSKLRDEFLNGELF